MTGDGFSSASLRDGERRDDELGHAAANAEMVRRARAHPDTDLAAEGGEA